MSTSSNKAGNGQQPLDWDSAEEAKPKGGAHPSWGDKAGQFFAGKVTHWDPGGGTKVNGDPCPLVKYVLAEPAYSIRKDGSRIDYEAGTEMTHNCSQVRVEEGVLDRDERWGIRPGDFIRFDLHGVERTSRGNTVKVVSVRLIPGDGREPRESGGLTYADLGQTDDAPAPF
jgi:hypothetical protein